jgi:ribosomal-protein-alanine N-acetyltransferase
VGGTAGGVGLRSPDTLRTERLELRRWRPEDREAFAALNGDPETMRFFEAPLTRVQSDALVDRYETCFEDPGVSTWAVTTVDGDFVGAVGFLMVPGEVFSFGPAVEVGWRLARPAWGHGYATEAARRGVTWAFTEGDLKEIVSFTAEVNLPSRAVMERLGMRRDPAEDFDHPRVSAGHRLQRHVLYRLASSDWVAA